jgi:hypothetical protein
MQIPPLDELPPPELLECPPDDPLDDPLEEPPDDVLLEELADEPLEELPEDSPEELPLPLLAELSAATLLPSSPSDGSDSVGIPELEALSLSLASATSVPGLASCPSSTRPVALCVPASVLTVSLALPVE